MNEPRTIPCPHCGNKFRDPNDAYNHVKKKHGSKAGRAYRDAHMEPREQSMGERLADNLIAAQCGEPVDEDIALMFTDEIAEAKKRGRADGGADITMKHTNIRTGK